MVLEAEESSRSEPASQPMIEGQKNAGPGNLTLSNDAAVFRITVYDAQIRNPLGNQRRI